MAPLETNDYNTNLLQEADESLDPFGDDDSLFLDIGEESVGRAATLRRRNTQHESHVDDDDFTPRLNYTKTIKRAKLVRGNYVIDAPVPKALLDTYARPVGQSDETSFVRYSGVTCGPLNFVGFNYALRQNMYSPPRETEIMVCITMYNEDEVLLGRTLQGVFENLENLTRRTDSVWGDGLWKKVTVVIVNDGRLQLNERTQKLLSALGVFQEGYAKSKVNNRTVKAHLYEYTSTVGVERVSSDRVYLNVSQTPVQLMFCLKEKNARKINSHRWCFQAFAPLLNPKVIMLLDCGTRPGKDAFYHLWSTFKDPHVAGACGEMRVALGPNKKLLLNPLVAAQNFEYKIASVLDKPMESVFGFISVLPGAFSAYRWDALLNVDGHGPLEKYFKGEFLHQTAKIDDEDDDEAELKERNFLESGIFTSNMYLAEDRILCFELVAKKNKNYVLRYVSSATAETDVPEKVDDFVLQRRRWLNGSLFAAMYSVFHWTQIWRSNHSLLRKLWLQLEFYYHLVTVLVSWFSLASFFLVFRILTKNLGSSEVGFSMGKYISEAFLWIYVGCIVCTFVLAFGNTPRGTKKLYITITVVFAVLMAYLLFGAVYLAVNTVKLVMSETDNNFNVGMLFTNQKLRDLVVSVVSTYILYAIGAVIHGEPSFMVTSFFQYLLLSPSYVNVLNIYSFCNIHDVSWGNRDSPQAKDLGTAKVTDVDGELVMTVVPGSPEELEQSYMKTLDDLKVAPVAPVVAKNKKEQDDSYYAFIRTITVLVWMLTNAILVGVVLAAGGDLNDIWNDSRNSTVFLTVILWVVCALAGFRLVGSVLYVLLKIGRPIRWWIQKRKTVD
ncbi:hypothetical protein METBIDRAFT_34831 [Metschnikowia bicuspidata var. bicuspidata NRRL YB-4993]|uniref:Chitin synthase n=1 Tax=Metschnikowia bicuspidata var. bicuspidata NRRL YB-4993 TaxID=869754 RepID=A0A1A0HFU1_9ASCO|nr:hypothetical protein METBIDRAFT_34831 [Metschnikowia bicuspidata var. bicuspidata NRRL YB-4993]OBA22723.1 hypothetical protein METBIDRAFT_34831 [Metschnikowia bicuspidata var. bicuspidata NRRL YB-4993]